MSDVDRENCEEWARSILSATDRPNVELVVEKIGQRLTKDERARLIDTWMKEREHEVQRLLLMLENIDPELAAKVQAIIDESNPPWNTPD